MLMSIETPESVPPKTFSWLQPCI